MDQFDNGGSALIQTRIMIRSRYLNPKSVQPIQKHICRLLAIPILLIARNVSAQTTSDLSSIIPTMMLSLGCLVITILGVIIFKRVSGRRRDDISGATGLDLMSLKKKNLLTPEEMKKVREAISRQMAKKEAQERRRSGVGASTDLMNDPEIQRIQTQARAAQAVEEEARNEASKTEATVDVVTQPDESEAANTVPEPKEIPLDDIELPPDVQQLADAGILTQEEIDNVKRRLRDRR